MIVYPHTWLTQQGHSVTVTNPAQDVYELTVLTKQGKKEIYSFYSKFTPHKLATSGHITGVQQEVYAEWAALWNEVVNEINL